MKSCEKKCLSQIQKKIPGLVKAAADSDAKRLTNQSGKDNLTGELF